MEFFCQQLLKLLIITINVLKNKGPGYVHDLFNNDFYIYCSIKYIDNDMNKNGIRPETGRQ